jgi:PAS domain S-box-containing protein
MPTPLRVLIIEDRPADAELMLHELRRHGYAPDWQRVDTESEYLRALEADDPGLGAGGAEVILADYHLPEFSAPRALALLQERKSDVPFIVVSGAIGEETAAAMVKQGASDYILKDRMARLGAAVEHALQERRLGSAKARAETALRESETRYRSLVELSPDAVVVHRQGKIVFGNPAAVKLVGAKDSSEVVGQPLLSFVHPDYRDLVRERVRQMTQEGKTVPLQEEKFIRLDGRVMDVEVAATPIVYQDQPSVMVVFRDVTERKRTESALRESEEKYRFLFEAAPVGIGISDPEGRVLAANHWLLGMLGHTREELIKLGVAATYARLEDRERLLQALRPTGRLVNWELELRRKDGSLFTALLNLERLDLGGREVIFTTVRDITEAKLAEARIMRLNRLYAVLSRINEAIVRIREPQPLCEETCRIAVEEGKFRLAWIGFEDFDTGATHPIARWGFDEGFVDEVSVRGELAHPQKSGRGLGPTDTALREGRYVIHDDFETNPALFVWRDLALRHGFRSSAAFPLRIGGETIGSVNLYSGEPRFFDPDQIRLLQALAADLSFALELIQVEQRRQAADQELRENEQRFRRVFEAGLLGVAIIDTEARFIKVNPALSHMLGYAESELLDLKLADLMPPGEGELAHQVQRLLSGETSSYTTETRLRTKAGEMLLVTLAVSLVADRNGKPIYAVVMVHDITERKRAEAALRESQDLYKTLLTRSPEAVMLLDWEGSMSYVSERLVQMHGYDSYRELVGRAGRELIAPEDRERASLIREDCLKNGSVQDLRFTMLRKDGTRFTSSLSVSLIRDASGQPFGFLGIARPTA